MLRLSPEQAQTMKAELLFFPDADLPQFETTRDFPSLTNLELWFLIFLLQHPRSIASSDCIKSCFSKLQIDEWGFQEAKSGLRQKYLIHTQSDGRLAFSGTHLYQEYYLNRFKEESDFESLTSSSTVEDSIADSGTWSPRASF